MTSMPVPYVTAYTMEEIDLSLVISPCEGAMGGRHLTYAQPRPEDWFLDVLWARQAVHRRGRPLFRDPNIPRQRECQVGRLCQVCRETAVDCGGRLWWVFNQEAPGRSVRTAKPPTCKSCIPEAVRSCRYLQDDARAYTSAAEYDPWGVVGDVYGAKRTIRREEIALTEFYRLEYTLALALIVNVRDLRPEPIP